MRRGLIALSCMAFVACASDGSDSVRPAESEVRPTSSSILVALPDGTLVIDEEGRLLAYDPSDPSTEPSVVGPASEVGEVHAAVPMGGAVLILASGGTFILRDGAWVPSPLSDSLDGPIVDAVQLPTPTGIGTGDLWIATASSLYRVVDMEAARFGLDEDLSAVELSLARRPEGPALWVRLPDRLLEVWRDRSGVVRSAALLLPSAPEAIGGDANLTGWLEIDGQLHSIGADRHLESHGVGVARLMTSPFSREVWVIDDGGATWLHSADRLYSVPDLSIDAAATMAVGTDGSLYVVDGSIRRYAPRHDARLVGAPDGALLVTPQTFFIEAEGMPAVEAELDGEPIELATDPLRVDLDPVTLGEGSHELSVTISYDDGTLPTLERRSFEVITDATWSEDVQPLYDAYCSACHGPEGPASTRLDTRADWETRIEVVRQNVEQGRMPLGRPPLTQREIALIQAWQVGGFSE